MASVNGTVGRRRDNAGLTIPPGQASVTMYVGAGSATNGMSVATTPVTFQCFPSSQGQQLYATTGSTATTVAIHYIVSTSR